jgi:hypothetical protein
MLGSEHEYEEKTATVSRHATDFMVTNRRRR